MTGPIPGYPDFQTPVLWSSRVIVDTTITIPAFGLQNITSGPQLNFAGAIISVLNADFFGAFIVQGYLSSLIAGVVTRFAMNFPPGSFRLRIPVTGTFFQINLQNNTAALGGMQELVVVGTNNVGQRVVYDSDSNHVNRPPQNIGAGATVRDQIPAVQPGPAQVYANTGAAAGTLALIVGVYNNDGTIGATLAEFDPLQFTENNQVYLPPEPCWIAMVNLTGGVLNASWSIYPVGGTY